MEQRNTVVEHVDAGQTTIRAHGIRTTHLQLTMSNRLACLSWTKTRKRESYETMRAGVRKAARNNCVGATQ